MNPMRTVYLDPPVSIGHAEELEKRLFFISAEIAGFKLIKNEEKILGIELSLIEGSAGQEVEDKIKKVIRNEIAIQKILPARIVWSSTNKHDEYRDDVFDQLVKNGMVFEMGEGQVCFSESLIKLMDALDDIVKNMTVSEFGAKEYRYPTLISTKALEKCGYFNSFPHMLMFVTRLHNDIDMYQEFLAEYQSNHGVGSYLFSHCKNVDYCLPPTMCYHTYHQLQNTQYPEDVNQVITSKGKSFRYESKYHRSLERLWDFTIREIVFLGSKDFVVESRQKYMESSFALIEKLGLQGHCEVASDPFFCSADTAAKILNQRMLELKYELRLNIDASKTIASASFNFHDHFFGERFNIKLGAQDWMKTGCVGFGIERLAYAFICQHGVDEARWYEVLRQVKNDTVLV